MYVHNLPVRAGKIIHLSKLNELVPTRAMPSVCVCSSQNKPIKVLFLL